MMVIRYNVIYRQLHVEIYLYLIVWSAFPLSFQVVDICCSDGDIEIDLI